MEILRPEFKWKYWVFKYTIEDRNIGVCILLETEIQKDMHEKLESQNEY